jgi:hypothetical protein
VQHPQSIEEVLQNGLGFRAILRQRNREATRADPSMCVSVGSMQLRGKTKIA